MADSTKARSRRKAAPKTHRDFPLKVHKGRGYWCKKVLGKVHYFGKVADDPKGQAALEKWLAEKDDLLAGRKPRAKDGSLTIQGLCNRFLEAKEQQRDSGEISNVTFVDYNRVTDRLIAVFGLNRRVDDLRAGDFEKLRGVIAKKYGLVSLGNEINRIRIVFKYAYDAELIDKPLRFGPTFKRPSKKTLRIARNGKAAKMFEAAEIGQLLVAAPVQIRAMILLGLNCGFGNADVGTLPQSALDLAGGWVNYPRPKTGVDRRCHLWPETVESLAAAIKARPKPKDEFDEGLVFLTKYGQPWHKDKPFGPLSLEFAKLTKKLGLYRKGCGFYALRHGLETIGGETKDQVAVNAIMGHVDASMAATYRERIDDHRLAAVSWHVRGFLFPTVEGGAK